MITSNKSSNLGFTGKTQITKGVAAAAAPDSRKEPFLSEAEFSKLSEMERKEYFNRMNEMERKEYLERIKQETRDRIKNRE